MAVVCLTNVSCVQEKETWSYYEVLNKLLCLEQFCYVLMRWRMHVWSGCCLLPSAAASTSIASAKRRTHNIFFFFFFLEKYFHLLFFLNVRICVSAKFHVEFVPIWFFFPTLSLLRNQHGRSNLLLFPGKNPLFPAFFFHQIETSFVPDFLFPDDFFLS